MANYNLVVNSKFQPFSFERYIQPYQMYGAEYKEVENALGELNQKASIWEEMANAQTDPMAYNLYKTYSEDLQAQANKLATEGLNRVSRSGLMNMRSRYSKEIIPIEQAYATRKAQDDQQQQALLQDDSLIYDRLASQTSLDDYLKNPQLSYTTVRGKNLTAKASQAAKALSKNMREEPRKWRRILGDQYYETTMRRGFTKEEILQAAQRNPDFDNELTKIVDDVVGASGIKDWGNQEALDKAYYYTNLGLWDAIGDTQYQVLQNQDYIRANSTKGSKGKITPESKYGLNPYNIYSMRKMSEQQKLYDENIKYYSKFFNVDSKGNVTLNEAGKKEFDRQEDVYVKGTPYMSPEGVSLLTNVAKEKGPSKFRQFMESIGYNDIGPYKNGETRESRLGSIWKAYADNNPAEVNGEYDATKYTAYKYNVPQSRESQTQLMNSVLSAMGNVSYLSEVDFDSNGDTVGYTPVGKNGIAKKDFTPDNYTIISRDPSEFGEVYYIKDNKTNEVKTYSLKLNNGKVGIPGMNMVAEQGREVALQNMSEIRQILQSENLSDEDRAKYEEFYDYYAQQLMINQAQIDFVNTTKDQQFQVIGQ